MIAASNPRLGAMTKYFIRIFFVVTVAIITIAYLRALVGIS